MKIVSIGDTHGRDTWKQVVEAEKDADKIVFIGDYFDSFDIKGLQQLENFLNICQYKKDNPDKVILLIGNHDYHYWPGIYENYSGYQHVMRPSFEQALNNNKKLLQMCFVDEYNNVYSHAGFTETFVEQRIGSFSEKNINDIWKYKPQTFKFYDFDRSQCGEDIHQSCIWVRPQSLYNDRIPNLQIVGHTTVRNINHPQESEKRGFYLIDAIEDKQYLVCIDGKFEIRTLSSVG